MWAIIGGSGFENFSEFKLLEDLATETPFGDSSTGLKKVNLMDQEVLFLSRHGKDHEKLPSEINYRANIYALKKYGATAILSFSAVGSLREELAPGDLVIPTQYLDRTKGLREHSFCGDGVVGHVSLAHPVCKKAAERVHALVSDEINWKTSLGKTYVSVEGPYFSTMAESHMYRDMHADIIGMTNFPEYALAREAGLSYMPCCFVTDYDCWNTEHPHVTNDEVIRVAKKNNKKAFSVAKNIIKKYKIPSDLWRDGIQASELGLKSSLMTSLEKVSKRHEKWLEIVLS